MTPSHDWVCGGLRADRERLVGCMDLPALLVSTVDAHRQLRGPYTATGTVLRGIVPGLVGTSPDLVRAHDIEILTIAPELRGTVPASRETLTSLAIPAERTRFYSRLRTLRIAHGVAELLREHLANGEPRSLVLENVEQADPTDAELVAVLLRRIDPARLRIVVCGGRTPDRPLTDALARYATAHRVEASDVDSSGGDPAELAALYVHGDCTSDDPALRAAYAALDPQARVAMHDARADELAARNEESLLLGAVPYHRERGGDSAGAGADALRHALDQCIDFGFYDAVVDFGRRGRAVVDWSVQLEHWWAFTTKMTTSLAALGRTEEAEELYTEARACTDNPRIHMQAAYATAMLYTRHHEPDRRDDRIAKSWINEAVAIASLDPDPEQRAFQTVFMGNGLALIEVHLGNLPEALRLVDEGLARLDGDLGPDDHRLHRSVLRHNRAQVYAGLGRLEDALADYDAVIVEDPNYAEYYFDRGNLLRRLGRDTDALADYETAGRLSPPFPEVYYNRADVLLALGDIEHGLAGLNHVLDIAPEFIDALVNRAGLLAALGDADAARRDAEAGLALAPDNPHLHCVLGQLEAAAGRTAQAVVALDTALEADPSLVAAWAARAAIAFDIGDIENALSDLDRALELGEDAVLLFNRAAARRAAGRWADALADLDRALALDPQDADIRAERERCLARSYSAGVT